VRNEWTTCPDRLQKEKEKLLEKLLENTTAEHCLELCADDSVKETDQVSAPFAAFDAQVSVPQASTSQAAQRSPRR
jgi:hypothetical protein